MANRPDTTIPLSALTSDPVLRAFFARQERDSGQAYAVPAANPPSLSGGAAKTLKRELVVA